ncbi:MAG: GxxExxY protein [Chloroflexi bacterium]|nr:GxxExxY protein [Chloroflexota bacterium]
MPQLILEDQTYQLRGALFQVYRELKGSGISESAWESALAIVLDEKKIPHKEQTPYSVHYKGVEVGRYYTDVIAWDIILLELKSSPEDLSPLNMAQTISYLRVTGLPLALLVNFGATDIEIKRVPNFLEKRSWQDIQAPAFQAKDTMLFPELVYAIRGILLQVHFELGPGFIHFVYRRAAQVEMRERGIPFEFKKQIPVMFHHQVLQNVDCRLIIVENSVAVATVALKEVTDVHRQRLARYLGWLNLKIGLLANFYKTTLEIETIRV